MAYIYTTGWTSVHGNTLVRSSYLVQADILCDDDNNKEYATCVRVWDKVADEIVETPLDDWITQAGQFYGKHGWPVCSRTLPGEAYYRQLNAEWQPVNQRLMDELASFCKHFK